MSGPEETGQASDLPHILNWRRIDGRITSSGQPSEAQLAEIAAMGVPRIINLGPHDNKGALADEPGTVAALGMDYVYIPVDFEAPTEADYTAFCAAMAAAGDGPVHVHCIYNARVSAFFYRYFKEHEPAEAERLFAMMDGIWRPGGVWAEFIGRPEDAAEQNRYAGYEY